MLSSIPITKQYYSLPSEDITESIVIPGIKNSDELDIMTGWFSGRAIGELAQGFAYFLKHSDGVIRIITCPQLLPKDQEAIDIGSKTSVEVLEQIFEEFIDNIYERTTIEKYSLKCMAYLIAKKRLIIKLAYMKKRDSLFHKKINLLSNKGETLVITGSTNFTPRGLRSNEENVIIFRNWIKNEADSVKQMRHEFDVAWNGNNSKNYVLCEASDAMQKKIIQNYHSNNFEPIQEYENIISGLKNKALLKQLKDETLEFAIPSYINYKEGDYKHQGEAVDSWIKNDYRGILRMCTGAGKTITSLISTALLLKEVNSIFVVIAVPKRPLLYQWAKDVENFSGKPVLIVGNRSTKFKLAEKSIRLVEKNITKIEILICTHDFLCQSEFHQILEKREKVNKLLIADECHNLGIDSFINNKPEMFQYRMGLSATPERQYDREGTQSYFEYFNKVVYEFNLEDGINVCLVPYYYHVHPVHLTVEEMEEYNRLSNEIKKFLWALEDGKSHPALDPLLRARRLLLEQCSNKIDVFKCVFGENFQNDMTHNLVFLSDKQNDQIREVNDYLLNDLSLNMHQITSEETQSNQSEKYIKEFKSGKIQVLTSMKILDEGLNVPEIQTAYILASTTVERGWTQRRGRVLRKCDEINKNHAVIHDFIVIVPNEKSFSTLINSEKKRIREFAKLSLNPYTPSGGFTIIEQFYGE